MLHFGNMYLPWDSGLGSLIGVLISIMLVVVFVRIIIRLIRHDYCRHRYFPDYNAEGKPAGNAAGKILDERYAKGEIDDDEYKRKKNLK